MSANYMAHLQAQHAQMQQFAAMNAQLTHGALLAVPSGRLYNNNDAISRWRAFVWNVKRLRKEDWGHWESAQTEHEEVWMIILGYDLD